MIRALSLHNYGIENTRITKHSYIRKNFMKYLIAFVITICTVQLNAQLYFHGSFVIVAICQDGILIGSDSRVSFNSPEDEGKNYTVNAQKVIGYFDDFQKIFPLKNCAYVSVGPAILGDKFMAYYLDTINKLMPNTINVTTAYDYINSTISTKFPEGWRPFMSLKIFIAGYFNNMPCIKAFVNGIAQPTAWRYGFYTSDNRSSFKAVYNRNLTCQQMKLLMDLCIKQLPTEINEQTIIGGKSYFLEITPKNEFIWLDGALPQPQPKNFQQLYKLYHSNKIKMTFVPPIPENKVKFEAMLDSTIASLKKIKK